LQFVILPLALSSWLLLPSAACAQSNAVTKIGAIHVQGEKMFSEEQIVAATGLRTGQAFDRQKLDDATAKLGRSGAFQEVNYSYAPAGGAMAIQFTVQEGRLRGCHFDNFVWLSDEEITRGLQLALPLYIGRIPETGEMLDDIPPILEKLSMNKGVAVQVTRRIQQSRIGDPDWSHLYAASGVAVKVQSLRFVGAQTINPTDLEKEAAALVGREYSAFQSGLFAGATIIPFYRERGYLRAKVDASGVEVVSHAEGSREYAVRVIYTVMEGAVYRWTPVAWKGNQALASTALDALTGMKADDLANGKKIDEGWAAVHTAYGKNGYIDAGLQPEPVFDEEKQRVQYQATVTEGPQYHMGQFVLLGVPPGLQERLGSRWKLKAGDAFDASYPMEFVTKEVFPALHGAKVRTVAAPNREQHVVDITLKVE
jgi:outer membrane protein assembly factor BamA